MVYISCVFLNLFYIYIASFPFKHFFTKCLFFLHFMTNLKAMVNFFPICLFFLAFLFQFSYNRFLWNYFRLNYTVFVFIVHFFHIGIIFFSAKPFLYSFFIMFQHFVLCFTYTDIFPTQYFCEAVGSQVKRRSFNPKVQHWYVLSLSKTLCSLLLLLRT